MKEYILLRDHFETDALALSVHRGLKSNDYGLKEGRLINLALFGILVKQICKALADFQNETDLAVLLGSNLFFKISPSFPSKTIPM